MNPPGPDVLRILIATDNHLGFLSSDPIRGEDSFDTLDEILQIGRDRHCDCAFFSGDLFHHNKPSRRVMFRSQQVFKKHVFGPGPVSIQVTSDQEENFGGRIANYEDPTLAVQFPIFMIHGNHDDPCREGPIGESLSAVDMLAESGLVNYFGRADKANDIRIRPVMIEKGKCKVALYGLGWVRDERLHRTFADEKVTFVREAKPEGGEETRNAFNVMLIHQNRAQKGRGEKNGVAESMIPEFMDLVFWGHEHECEIKPVEKGTFFLSQPGSSIAVSLVEGEAVPKHCGILEIKFDDKGEPTYRLVPVRLKTVRPFLLDTSLELSQVPELNSLPLPEQEKQDRVFTYLTSRVEKMIEQYYENLPEKDPKPAPIPIVRIKVEHTGYSIINLQRFGAQFTSRVANPDELLQFYRKKRLAVPSTKKTRRELGQGLDDSVLVNGGDGEEGEDDLGGVQSVTERIQRLSEKVLRESAQQLDLLGESNLHLAVEEFVVKENATSIAEFVEESIERMRKNLRKDGAENAGRMGSDEATMTGVIQRYVEKERKRDESQREREGLKQAREAEEVSATSAAASAVEEEEEPVAKRGRKAAARDSEEEEEIMAKPVKKTAARKPAAAARPTAVAKKPTAAAKNKTIQKRANSPFDEDENLEEEEQAPKRTRVVVVVDDDDEEDSDKGATSSMLSQAKFGVKRRN